MRTLYELARVIASRAALLLGWCLLAPALARAGDAATAEELFQRGKERMAARDYAEGCALLAESYRLEPATGSLLARALCHEREGKLATALSEYRDAAVRARAQRSLDRVEAAQAKVASLEGKVSTLTVARASATEPAGLEVRLNGALLQADELGRALPLDGGPVLIEALAPGRPPWRSRVTLAVSGDAQTVVIGDLAPAPAPMGAATPAEPVAAPKPAPVAPVPSSADARLSVAQWTGIGLMSGGAVALGVGLGYTVRAIRKDDASEAGCLDDFCTPGARADRLEARDAGNAATIAIATGLSLGTAGLVTYLIGRRRPDRAAARAKLGAAAWAAPDRAGGALLGRF